ncbi:N-6 DNA methylase (plasmid) [Dermatophilaceae bacterium Sec6.4]
MQRATEVLSDDLGPVNGLVDNRRAAAMLGVSVNTFRVWATRSQAATSGIAAAMPAPIATMHGHVYREDQIEDFGRQIALNARAERTAQRRRGAYFTPDDAANVMVRWAVRGESDVIVEPSVGDGQFALAAQLYATSRNWDALDLHACELDPATAAEAVASGAVTKSRVHVGDFLSATNLPMSDVVIGNPPFVRVRELDSTLRRNALDAAASTMGGLAMDTAGSVWMPFVSKATAQLKRGGRLAFVLPLDFTYVRYARPLWELLGRSFGRIRVLRFRERVFRDIMQNVLVLLAEERGGTTSYVEQLAHDRLADLSAGIGAGVPIKLQDVVRGERAFQYALLPEVTRDALAVIDLHTSPASDRVKFNIGYVSGNKSFFHPDQRTTKSFRLPKGSLLPTIGSSRQLSRGGVDTSSMSPSSWLWLPGEKLTKGEREYVAQGEHDGVDMGYKCRIRKPWYRVPGVKTPDLVLTTFSDRPRLYLNDAGWVASNSVLCGYAKVDQDPRNFVNSWYTPLTLLSTELQIHSLGGGVMIAVPREADAVRILNPASTPHGDAEKLNVALRSGDAAAAYAAGATSIENLVGTDGLAAIWEGADTLACWRKAQNQT